MSNQWPRRKKFVSCNKSDASFVLGIRKADAYINSRELSWCFPKSPSFSWLVCWTRLHRIFVCINIHVLFSWHESLERASMHGSGGTARMWEIYCIVYIYTFGNDWYYTLVCMFRLIKKSTLPKPPTCCAVSLPSIMLYLFYASFPTPSNIHTYNTR